MPAVSNAVHVVSFARMPVSQSGGNIHVVDLESASGGDKRSAAIL